MNHHGGESKSSGPASLGGTALLGATRALTKGGFLSIHSAMKWSGCRVFYPGWGGKSTASPWGSEMEVGGPGKAMTVGDPEALIQRDSRRQGD